MTRLDLLNLFNGVGVELGVAAGCYSVAILGNPRVERLYSVDRWSDHHDEVEYQKAHLRLSAFGSRSCIIRDTFAEALLAFHDHSLEFVYVDGYAHTGQDDGRTLWDWWPKVKSGGIFAGHDYHADWQPTIDAVNKFVNAHGLTLNVGSGDKYPSWWVVKP